MKAVLWLVGGACAATGLLALGYGGIGVPAGPTATVYSTLGYDALPDLVINGQGFMGIGIAVFGIALMVYNNATAWKETGGY